MPTNITVVDIGEFLGPYDLPKPSAPGATLHFTNTFRQLPVMSGITFIPKGYSHVTFHRSMSRVEVIGNCFLIGCSGLKSLDLSPLSGVLSIGNEFLRGCSDLKSLDLNSLSGVFRIGTYFLYGCSGLASIDLSPLRGVTSIGEWFLYGCSGLTSIDLSPLSGVTSIGDYFLSGCSGLTSLDLRPLSGVTSIGNGFLSGCSGLTSLDLRLLRGVTSIGNGFLHSCSGLTDLDFSPLSGVSSIGDYFLTGCSGLTSLDLSPLKGVSSIDNCFLFDCSGLTNIDLSPLSGATSIGDGFLHGCSGLAEAVKGSSSSANVSVLESQTLIISLLDQVDLRRLTVVRSIAAPVSSSPVYCSIGTQCSPATPWGGQAVDDVTTTLNMMKHVKKLGEGGQGTVSLFLDPATHQLVAIKCVPSSNNSKVLHEEYTKLAKLDHPNIIRVFNFLEDTEVPGYSGNQDCILMEHMPLGCVGSLVIRRNHSTVDCPDFPKWLGIARQTLSGLECLHENKMLHRDLKPSNILMTFEGGNLVYKLADLGLGAEVDESVSKWNEANTIVGSLGYTAPESIEQQKYSARSDVYAWACTMGYVATGMPPKAYQKGRPQDHRGYTAPELQSMGTKLPVKVAELLVRCFTYDRKARPEIATLLEVVEAATTAST